MRGLTVEKSKLFRFFFFVLSFKTCVYYLFCFDKALELKSNYALAYILKGSLVLADGQLDAAPKYFQQATNIRKDIYSYKGKSQNIFFFFFFLHLLWAACLGACLPPCLLAFVLVCVCVLLLLVLQGYTETLPM